MFEHDNRTVEHFKAEIYVLKEKLRICIEALDQYADGEKWQEAENPDFWEWTEPDYPWDIAIKALTAARK